MQPPVHALVSVLGVVLVDEKRRYRSYGEQEGEPRRDGLAPIDAVGSASQRSQQDSST